MQYFKFIFLIFFFFSSFSISIAQNFTLTIQDGYGNGTFEKGDSINVWADRAGGNEVFTHWSGTGAEYLLLDKEWHTRIIIPNTVSEDQFNLVANYDDLGNWSNGQWTLTQWAELNEDGSFIPADKIVEYAYPENPKAIVFLIHGTNGNSSSWITRYERRSLVKDLVYNNYAVFALNSNETSVGDQDGDGNVRWENNFAKQDTATNIDFKNVLATRDYIFENIFLQELPVFMIGGSNGANFTDFCTWALDFKASTHMTGNGLAALFQNVNDLKPILWIQSKNDNNPSANPAAALSYYNQLLDLGITSEWHWLERSPAYPFRFNRSSNQINNQTSIALYDSLKSNQWLDDNDYLVIQNVNTDFPLDDFLVDFNFTNAQKTDFNDQLNVINADHGANGDFNKTIIRFFDDCLLMVSNNELSNKEASDFSIFPNPFDSFLSIQSEHTPTSFSFEIFDINGRSLFSKQQHYSNDELDTTTLLSGIYILKIKSINNYTQVYKLIKL